MRQRWLTAAAVAMLFAVGTTMVGHAQDGAAADTDQRWTSINLDPAGRRSQSIATVGDTVLMAGGRVFGPGGVAALDSVYVYDGAARRWATARLSEARGGAASATVGHRALFAGGFLGNALEKSAAVDIYDNASGQWSAATLSVPRDGLSAATVGSRVLFAGGSLRTNDGPSNAVDIYDDETGQWSVAALSEPRDTVRAAVVGSRVLFVGGLTPEHDSDAVDIYDCDTGQWSTAKLSQGRRLPTVVTVGHWALFAGGESRTGHGRDAVDFYDGATGAWSSARLSRWPLRSAAPAMGTTGLFLSGGGSDPVALDIFDSTTGEWSNVSFPDGQETAAARGDWVVLGDRVYFGSDHAVAVLDLPTRQWSVVPLPHIRTVDSAVAAGTTLLFVGASGTESGLGADILDSGTGAWTFHALSQWRMRYTVATAGRRVLFAGGSTSPPTSRTRMKHVDAVDIYDGATGTWSIGRLSLARETPLVRVAGDNVLFIGGVLGCAGCAVDTLEDIVDVYDGAVRP